MEKEKLNLKEPEKVEAYVSGEGITLTPPQPTIMLEFHKDGKYSCLDFKDGEWQFWGTMPIGKSANLFWKEVISKLAKQKTENLLLQEKAKWKREIDYLIADEMCICHQEKTPTSRLTSLAVKIDKL